MCKFELHFKGFRHPMHQATGGGGLCKLQKAEKGKLKEKEAHVEFVMT